MEDFEKFMDELRAAAELGEALLAIEVDSGTPFNEIAKKISEVLDLGHIGIARDSISDYSEIPQDEFLKALDRVRALPPDALSGELDDGTKFAFATDGANFASDQKTIVSVREHGVSFIFPVEE